MIHTFPLTTAAILAAILVYIYATLKVGRARGRYGVEAPQVHGHPDFERVFRAHQNTLEQLVIFLPLSILLASLFSDQIGAAYGLLWVVGRILFIEGYARAAKKRALGFVLSGLASMIAAVVCAVVVVMQILG